MHPTRRRALNLLGASSLGLAVASLSPARADSHKSGHPDYVFEPGERALLPIIGSDQVYPVRRIYGVGFNYAAPGTDVERGKRPLIFDKPTDSLVVGDADITYPLGTNELKFEVELVVAMGREASELRPSEALDYVFGYAVGNDLTRWDLIQELRAANMAWDPAKTFADAAPSGPLYRTADVGHPSSGRIWSTLNGAPMQDGDLAHMIWSVPEIISELSKLFRLVPGDLIYTGTPAGNAPCTPGDEIILGIDGLGSITNRVI